MDLIEKVKILNNHLNAGNFKKVIEGSAVILKKIPENSYVLNLVGMAYQGLNQHKKSIEIFEMALARDTKNIAAKNNLANSLKAIGELKSAKLYYEEILKIDPNYINAYNNYANLKTITNDYEGAIFLYQEGLKSLERNGTKSSDPKFLGILFSIAVAYHSINNIDKANETINKILAINPNHTAAHKLLSSIIKYSNNNEVSVAHLKKMLEVIKNDKLDDNQKIDIKFALGKSYDDLKDYEKAYNFISEAKKLRFKKLGSNLLKEETNIKNLIKIFKEINLDQSHKDIPGQKIIFICGMPRSGTTLVEQIIASHNKVYGAGELIYLQQTIRKNFEENSRLNINKILESVNSKTNLVYKDYLKNFDLYNLNNAEFITDKAPQNFTMIGFIKLFFPNCKIIHCVRNPKDVCLSLFKNSFASSSMAWSNNENDIPRYFNLYNEIMNFWKNKIPNFIYDAQYEKIIEDKENEIKKILNFCDLDLDEKCFNHHKNSKTPIKTVSISQARQPIYSSSVNLSSKYDLFLNKMFNQLV